jgi:hypothetical protein
MSGIQVESNGTVATFEHDKVVIVGRGQDADFTIDDRTVSRHHGELKFDQTLGAWLYNDLGSANGSYTGSLKISTAEVIFPMTIRLGEQSTAPEIKVTEFVSASPKIEAVVEHTIVPPTPILPVTPVMPTGPITMANPVSATCSYCNGIVNAEFGPRCPDCAAHIHRDCWNEIGGCNIISCSANPQKANG